MVVLVVVVQLTCSASFLGGAHVYTLSAPMMMMMTLPDPAKENEAESLLGQLPPPPQKLE